MYISRPQSNRTEPTSSQVREQRHQNEKQEAAGDSVGSESFGSDCLSSFLNQACRSQRAAPCGVKTTCVGPGR